MPQIPIIMPQLGESIAEATIIQLLVKPGDTVEADQDLIEVETNKATMTVTSPCKGRFEKFLVKLDESYAVGAVLGHLEASEGRSRAPGPRRSGNRRKRGKERVTATRPMSPQAKGVQPTVRGLPVPANAAGASYLSPRMKARMDELGLHAADLAGIAGSGAAGRVTIEDFEKFHLAPGKASSARPRPCAWPWPMPCGEVGRGRWRTWACPSP